ncbi:ester cyclase [Clostridium sediminicola]|uniref:ester cyclase n=1 Tax=Clostridium sediminicola TaxID=3114879 RepID=UPI0031F1ED4B
METSNVVKTTADKKKIKANPKVDSKNEKNGDVNVMGNSTNSNKVFYGDINEVNSVIWRDYNDFAFLEGKNKQKLEGYDEKYNDFVHYIIKITHDIWEEKGIGVIYDTYSNNVHLHLSSQTAVGIQGVISNTLQNLHAFPDRRLIGQNVIFSPYDNDGLLSSHRIVSTATSLGDSSFGPATGKKINYRTVVDCAAYKNRIFEEWLVRDNLWIVKQLGLDPHEVAKKFAKASKNQEPALQSKFGIGESMEGQFYPELYKAKDDSVGEMVLEMISSIWNRKLINKVKDFYHDNASLHYICNTDLNGFDEIQGMFISLFSSFPNAGIVVERVSCNQRGNQNAWDVAVRLRINGIHEGYGYFGDPSGKRVSFMIMDHYHIVDNKVKEQWMTFDGIDVLRQIYMGDEEEA